ncbi:MAG: 50S ribosomal protein L18 [Chloroherpetonaceae bacterium]|jgi:large subunit ribosomal protein L18|nr:50S ribosomal protein L18 [bacterium]
MNKQELKHKRQTRRKLSVRKKISGNQERPRMTVYRSLNNIFVQIINDEESRTLLSASSIDKEIKGQIPKDASKSDLSKIVGKFIAKRAIEKNITKVVFDRNGYNYHGRVKALADSARENGLNF